MAHVRRFLRSAPEGGKLSENLRRHVLDRIEGGRLSRSYHDQLISALRLFCFHVLGQKLEELPLPRPRREKRLPPVLSPMELERLLKAVRNLKHLAILAIAYSAGLRVSEVVALRPEDLERERGLLRVRSGKGRKERYTLLSATALRFRGRVPAALCPGPLALPGRASGPT